MPATNKRMCVSRPEGGFALRVYAKKKTRRLSPHVLIRCGCCDEQVRIFHDKSSMEINGVQGSLENWREVLYPMLFSDATKQRKKVKPRKK